VEAGTMTGQIHDALHAVNMSLQAYYPAFRNLTVGGVISTGSYGSSLNRSSVLADSIISLDLVDGKGNLLTLAANDARLAAARTSIGVLGVIVRVTLPIIPQFKIRMQVLTLPDSIMQQPDFIDLIRNGTYVSFGWYPRAKVIIVEHGQQVSSSTPGDGKAITFNPDPKFLNLDLYSKLLLLIHKQTHLTTHIPVKKHLSMLLVGRIISCVECVLLSVLGSLDYVRKNQHMFFLYLYYPILFEI
jgi:hypothetical protein